MQLLFRKDATEQLGTDLPLQPLSPDDVSNNVKGVGLMRARVLAVLVLFPWSVLFFGLSLILRAAGR
jgi:hypothetical protein